MYKTTIPVMFQKDDFDREKALAECRRSGAERIALILNRELDYRFSSPENLENLKYHIAYFKDAGFEVMVWVGELVGHDPDKPLPGLPYRNMRYFGKGDIAAFCMLDPVFRSAAADWIRDIASCGADMIMLDDDYRLGSRPGGAACCCPLHMAALEKELGEPLDEEGFRRKAFSGGKNRYRDAWIRVCGDAKREFSRALRAAADSVNPKTRLGFCTAPSAWDFDGADAVEIAGILAGNTKPFLRLAGAPYWCRSGNPSIGDVVEQERMLAEYCKDTGIEIFSEGDTYPRPRFTTPASHLECFDMMLRAAGTTDGILKYMLDYVSQADYETGYIDAHVRNRELYREITALFEGKTELGVRPFHVMRIFETRKLDADNAWDMIRMQDSTENPAARMAVRCSLPTTYKAGTPVIVFGQEAEWVTPEDLRHGAILDLPAMRTLTARGIDVGYVSDGPRSAYQKSSLSDMPNEYFPEENQYTLLMQYSFPDVRMKPGARCVTRFRQGGAFFDGVCEYENAEGMRFMLLPFDGAAAPQGFYETYARRRQIMRSLAWMTGTALPVDIDGNYPMLYPMLKTGNGKIAMGLWNLFDDRIDGLCLKTGVPVKDVRFVNCKGHTENGRIQLDTPLYPYEFAGVEITAGEPVSS